MSGRRRELDREGERLDREEEELERIKTALRTVSKDLRAHVRCGRRLKAVLFSEWFVASFNQ